MSHFQKGTQDNGAGAEHVVPGDRPQPAEILRYLPCIGRRFPEIYYDSLQVKKIPVASETEDNGIILCRGLIRQTL